MCVYVSRFRSFSVLTNAAAGASEILSRRLVETEKKILRALRESIYTGLSSRLRNVNDLAEVTLCNGLIHAANIFLITFPSFSSSIDNVKPVCHKIAFWSR